MRVVLTDSVVPGDPAQAVLDDARRARFVVWVIAECLGQGCAQDEPLGLDTDHLLARLCWDRAILERALYDARLKGYISACLTPRRRLHLSNIGLKPAGRLVARTLSRVDPRPVVDPSTPG